MLITVQLQKPDGPFTQVDDSQLIKREGVIDNENEYTTTVEYCFRNCRGKAHQTGKPDAPWHFCELNVHRAVTMRPKKTLDMESAQATF